jgi:hypothetical protein
VPQIAASAGKGLLGTRSSSASAARSGGCGIAPGYAHPNCSTYARLLYGTGSHYAPAKDLPVSTVTLQDDSDERRLRSRAASRSPEVQAAPGPFSPDPRHRTPKHLSSASLT